MLCSTDEHHPVLCKVVSLEKKVYMPNIPVLILIRQQFSFNFKRPLKTLPKLKAWLKEVCSLYICGHYQCKNVFGQKKNIDNFLVCVHINFISIV